MRRFALFLICFLIVAAAPAALAEGYKTTIGSGADEITVVVLSGTPYEMGQSYGSLMATEVNACMTGYLSAAQTADPVRYSNAALDAAWLEVEPYVNTRFIQEMQGLAAGAGLPYDKLRRAHSITLVSDYACSAVGMWGPATANGHLYQIRNLDYEKDAGLQPYPVIAVYLPETGVAHANVAFAGYVGSMAGMNAEGIALSEIGDSPDSDYPYDLNGIPFFVMFRDIMQDCHSLDQVIGIVTDAQRIKKYHYMFGDGDALAAVKMRAHAPNLDIWTDNDPTDELYPNVRDNVVYETMHNDLAWDHINTYYGTYDADRMIELSRLVRSEGGNLMNVVFDATTREMWIAYAEGSQDASERPYVHFSLNDYLPSEPVGGYGFYEVIGSGDDQITVLHVGGTHYQMGYWHGKLLASQVQENAASAIAAAESWGVTEEYWQSVISAMWPYVPQEYLDEMQGLADGAGLMLADVWKLQAIPDISEFHCSAFAALGAATVGGHCIQLRNLDYGLELGVQNHPLVAICEPTGRNKYANVTFAGMLGSIAGMSYEHIPVSEMGDSFDYDNETFDGEPMPFVLKDVLELATSCTQAVNIVGNAHRTSSLWYTVSDPEEGQAALMQTSPTIFNVYNLGDPPGGILPALTDVIYGGYFNDRLYNDLSTNWGNIDPAIAIAISVNNAMNSNLMNVVYDATTLEMWMAYAQGEDRAANRPYVYLNLTYPTNPIAKNQPSTLKPFLNETVTFSAAKSSHPNPNHHIVLYEWDWESDGTYDATGVTATHSFATEGTHNVTLRVTDDFIPGNMATDTVALEVSDRPVITAFTIANGAVATKSLGVSLQITCARAAKMRFRNSGGEWSAWRPYAATTSWTLAAGPEGMRQVGAQCITSTGIASLAVSDTILYDTSDVVPSGRVLINGGAPSTESLAVTLNLYAKGATQMQFKNRYTDEWGAWRAFASTLPWTLAQGGEGQRAVYVRFRDGFGSLSAPGSDTIVYDTDAPPVGSISINNRAAYTETRSVTLTLIVTAAKEVRLRQSEADAWGAWMPYASRLPWNLATGADGLRTVYAQYRDYLGNLSTQVADSIYLDGPTPPAGSIAINGGEDFTLSLNVIVANNVAGAAQMRFKGRYSDEWGPWAPFAATKPWKLWDGNDGQRAVYAEFKDRLGNVSKTMVDAISYDTFDAPNLTYFRINQDAAQTATLEVTLNVTAGGAAQMRFRNRDTDPWSAWQAYAPTANWTLLGGVNGTRTVYAQCRDYLGTLSSIKADTITLQR